MGPMSRATTPSDTFEQTHASFGSALSVSGRSLMQLRRKLRTSKRSRALAGAAKSPPPAVTFGGNGWTMIDGIHSGLSAVIVGRCIGGLRYRHAPYLASLCLPGRHQRAEGDGSQSDNRRGRYVC